MSIMENDLYYNKLKKKSKIYGDMLIYMNSAHKITPHEFVNTYSEEELENLLKEGIEQYKGYKLNMMASNGKQWSSEPIDDFFASQFDRKRKSAVIDLVLDPESGYKKVTAWTKE